MILIRHSKETLTPANLDHGDTLQFTLSNGTVWELTLLDTTSEVIARTVFGGAAHDPRTHQFGGSALWASSVVGEIRWRLIWASFLASFFGEKQDAPAPVPVDAT